jgi:hypothetical protein
MLEFYGLREHPFGVSPNPRFLYPSVQHREAMASLVFGIENQIGFAALIAEPGAGKTTLLFDILQRYRERASTAFVFNTQCCSGQDPESRLENEEDQATRTSRIRFPYTFAMGYLPRPVQVSAEAKAAPPVSRAAAQPTATGRSTRTDGAVPGRRDARDTEVTGAVGMTRTTVPSSSKTPTTCASRQPLPS